MHVTKMHGARNDFVVADARSQPFADASSFARWVCDRRAGIGADGFIVLETSNVADARMRTINADGSEAEMCGNGVRCAARWLDEAGEGDHIAFETGAGIVATQVVEREPEYLVRVAMGRPKISQISYTIPKSTFVDLGNPHVVIFETSLEAFGDLENFAKHLQTDPAFPEGTNVHIAVPNGTHSMRVRHWERGVGLTQACGTGAVACAAVAIERGLAASPVEVLVPGGRLVVEWDGKGEAHLTGPAVRVFDTQVNVGDAALR
jgi:diaminopimelate epimerase